MRFPVRVITTIAILVATAANYVSSVASLNVICDNSCTIHSSPLLVFNLLLAFAGTVFCFWHALRSIERSDTARFDIYDLECQKSSLFAQGDMNCWGWTRTVILTFTIGVVFTIFTGCYAYGSWPNYYGWNWIAFMLNANTGLNCALVWHPYTKLKDFSNKR
jgi:hypothetical protein